MSWYSKNQLSVTQGSAVVTGTDTDFVTFVTAGFGIFINKVAYEIASVDSATQLTLTETYAGATRTDAPYSIWPTQGLNYQVWQNTTTLIEEFGPLRNNLTLLNQQIADTAGYRDAANSSAVASQHSADGSAQSATAAKNSETNAGASANAAAGSATSANTSKGAAAASATAAAGSATDANSSKTAAAASAADALTNKNATTTLRSDAQAARDAALAAQAAGEDARDDAITAQGAAQDAVSSIQGFRDGAQAAQAAAEAARDNANDSKNAAAASATGASQSETKAAADASAAQTARNGAETARDASKAAQTASESARDTAASNASAAAQSAEDAANAQTAAEAAAARAEEPINQGAIEDALGGTPALLEGATFTGPVTVPAALTINPQDGDQEGGQVTLMRAANQPMTGNIIVDTAANQFRVYDDGNSARMLSFDMVNGILYVNGQTVYNTANLTKGTLGLGNVDNTSDVNKPISTAQQAAFNTKASKQGDTFTGNVTVASTGPAFVLNNTATTYDANVYFQRSGKNHWLIGDSISSNVFYVNQFSRSDGSFVRTPLQIDESGLTSLTNLNVAGNTLNGYTLPTSGAATATKWNRVLTVNPDGGSEVGYYLDFHADSAGSKDYDGRLTCDAAGNLSWSGNLYVNAGNIFSQGPDANIGMKSSSSGVKGRFVSQSDGNVVFYRTDAQGNDKPVWSISNNAGPFIFNTPVQSNGIDVRGGHISADTNGNIGQLEFSAGQRNAGWRNDGSNLYLLFSDSVSDAHGAGFNGYRPITVDFGGQVTLGHGLTVGGVGATINATLNANSYLNVAQQANFAAPIYANANNGGRQSIRCGDDAWLGDANIGHTISVTSTSDGNQGKLCFGQSTQTLGMTGNDNYLRWTGDFLVGSWFRQSNNGAGLYWENLGRGIAAADQGASYGTITTYGSGMNGWLGYAINNNLILMDNANDMRGLYSPNHGGWLVSWDNSANATFAQNITAYSDRRLKKDITPLEVDVWDKFRALKPVSYVRKDSGDKRLGLIAQEVEEQFPDLVITKDDPLETKSVSYGDLAGGPTVAVVQMLMDKVEQQDAMIASLNQKIDALMARMESKA